MKKAIAVILGLGVAGGATHALAGMKSSFPVAITSTYFTGTIGDARASSDSLQVIYCNLTALQGPNVFGTCGARNAAGTQKICNVDALTYPTFATVLGSITPITNVTVHYDSSGMCTQINVHNGSQNRPSTP